MVRIRAGRSSDAVLPFYFRGCAGYRYNAIEE